MPDAPLDLKKIISNCMLSFFSRNGVPITSRSLTKYDALLLGQYFCGLSFQTKCYFAPHPFDQVTADQLCSTLDVSDVVRTVAVTKGNEGEKIVGYFIFYAREYISEVERYSRWNIKLDPKFDCSISMSVADEYQGQGIGQIIMRSIISLARLSGRRRLIIFGGVQADNASAIHVCEKLGFKAVATFNLPSDKKCIDMLLDLGDRRGEG